MIPVPSARRRQARILAVVLGAGALALALGSWRSGWRRGREVGREYTATVPGVGPMRLRVDAGGGVCSGEFLTNGGGRAVGFELEPAGRDGRRVIRGNDWQPEPLAGRMIGWLDGARDSDGWRGALHLPGRDAAGFNLVPDSRILERRQRAGLSILEWGASLTLVARWPAPMSSDPWRATVGRILRDEVSGWFADLRSDAAPDWLQGLRERSHSDEWDGMLEVSTVWEDDTVASYHGAEYRYTGGAHGSHANFAWNFRREGSAAVPLRLEDLFREGSAWEDFMTSEARVRLEAAGASWPGEGAQVAPGRTFTVCPAGLRLYYDPYEVGSYAEGTYVVWIPWERLDAIRRPGIWRSDAGGGP